MENTDKFLKEGTLLYRDTYRIVKVIGQGGFGVTYLADEIALGRKVAIKEFFPKEYCNRDHSTSRVYPGIEGSDDFVEQLKSKFLKEAQNIAQLDCPNIIRILTSFEDNGTAYYVMDYIDGCTLAELVKKEGPMSMDRTLRYINKIGEALVYIHERHINHLDVKPANILVRKDDDEPILIDFGLSKKYDSSGQQTSSTPVGISHGYAPMEQYNADGVKEFSPQTDLYSLTSTLYFLLTGTVPPKAIDVFNDGLKFPADFPSPLVEIVRKGMAPSRKNRHESVRQFLSELNSAANIKDEDVVIEVKLDDEAFEKPETEETAIHVAPVVDSHNVKSVNTDRSKNEKEKKKTQPKKSNKGLWITISCILGFVLLASAVTLFFIINDSKTSSGGDSSSSSDKTEQTGKDNSSNEETATTVPADYNTDSHRWIDLGLPSGTKWASNNIGADNPWDSGKYYSWGNTTTSYYYTEDDCWAYGTYVSDLSGGNHDVATSLWGSNWCMPTSKQFSELFEECKWEDANVMGVDGVKATGPNGNSIFFPYAGAKVGDELIEDGTTAFYWTSTPDYENSDYAVGFYAAYGENEIKTNEFTRSVGGQVRPVVNQRQ